MARSYFITTNLYPLLNNKYLTCSVNILRFKTGRDVLDNRKAKCLENNENDFIENGEKNSITSHVNSEFYRMVESRQEQAKNTVIVQLNSISEAVECKDYLYTFGKFVCAYHYITKNHHMDMLLVEFRRKDNVYNLLKSASYFNSNTNIGVPTTILQYQSGCTVRPTSSQDLTKLKKYFHVFPNWPVITRQLPQSKSITEQMKLLCEKVKLSDIDTRLRFFTVHQLSLCLGSLFPTISILPFGSSINGFGHIGCDLDIVCTIRNNDTGNDYHERKLLFSSRPFCAIEKIEQQEFLKPVAMFLGSFIPGIINMQSILKARVPIIKFSNHLTNMECDLSSNNLSGFYMSQILYTYCMLDERVQPLVFTLRRWAFSYEVTSKSPSQHLTNFTLTLLIIFFLQEQQILPPINTIISTKKKVNQSLPIHTTTNKSTLEELLFHFFNFYVTFDFNKSSICVREGRCGKKPDHSPIYLINPLDTSLNVARNVGPIELNIFIKQCAKALNKYNNNKTKNLVDIIEQQKLKDSKMNEIKMQQSSQPVEQVSVTENDDVMVEPSKMEEIIK